VKDFVVPYGGQAPRFMIRLVAHAGTGKRRNMTVARLRGENLSLWRDCRPSVRRFSIRCGRRAPPGPRGVASGSRRRRSRLARDVIKPSDPAWSKSPLTGNQMVPYITGNRMVTYSRDG